MKQFNFQLQRGLGLLAAVTRNTLEYAVFAGRKAEKISRGGLAHPQTKPP